MAKVEPANRLIAENRKARFDYFIEDRYEAGMALQGWEVKALRAGRAVRRALRVRAGAGARAAAVLHPLPSAHGRAGAAAGLERPVCPAR